MLVRSAAAACVFVMTNTALHPQPLSSSGDPPRLIGCLGRFSRLLARSLDAAGTLGTRVVDHSSVAAAEGSSTLGQSPYRIGLNLQLG